MTVKYLHNDPKTGAFIYRRRVPKGLLGIVEKHEFLRVLGRTQGEAVVAYGNVHSEIQHLVHLATEGVTGVSPRVAHERLSALLSTWGFDPTSPGNSVDEVYQRDAVADHMLEKYRDKDSDDLVDVPEETSMLGLALVKGVPKGKPCAKILSRNHPSIW